MLSTAIISDEEKSNSSATTTEDAFCRFSLAEMKLATQNFDDTLVIGKGGFGKVYKGLICTRTVAIKRLGSSSMQGAAEFMAEIEILTEVRHCNLVSFIGYCSDENEMILVYEYMPKGSIYHHLHEDDAPLCWTDRLRISLGAARGLEYLHSTQHVIIHRNVTSSNILLDENWEAKIADFGLSIIVSQPSSGVITTIKGTFGYLDPEYCSTGMLTKESDVYSFGVVLFELLSGRRAADPLFVEEGIVLANWAKKCIKERRIEQVVSSHIKTQISSKCLKEFVQIADRCTKSSRKERPTMGDVVVALQQAISLQEQFDSCARAAEHLLFESRHNSDKLSTSTSSHPCLRFSLSEIQSATNNFNDKEFVGRGGFAEVYKGCVCIGETSHVVAIKRLNSITKQGEVEFRAEIEVISKLHHGNLVSLIGYCDDNKEMILVYEYMHRGTLYHHLHEADSYLNWVQRLKIAIGAAHGLDYLHKGNDMKQGIVHRDVKSSNILLDENWAAVISDFGLSKIVPVDHSISSSVKGTFGYMDPEYFYTRKLTWRTDVYAFGVVLLELLSGRLAVDVSRGEEECSLVRWAQKCMKERRFDQMVDPNIRGTVSSKCLRRFAQLANRCLHSDLKERPTMAEVVALLEDLLQLQLKWVISTNSSSTPGFSIWRNK